MEHILIDRCIDAREKRPIDLMNWPAAGKPKGKWNANAPRSNRPSIKIDVYV